MNSKDIKTFLTSTDLFWDQIKDMYAVKDFADMLQQVPDLKNRVRNPENWKRQVKYKVGGKFDQEERGEFSERFPDAIIREFFLIVIDPKTGDSIFGDEDRQAWAIVELDGKVIHYEHIGD